MADWQAIARRARAEVEMRARRLWMKYALRNVKQNDNHTGLDRAYLVPDPWKLDSPGERHRFEETNRIIQREVLAGGRAARVLELGSGEALQSEVLARLCDELTGVEVSARAVERARERLPQARFLVGDLLALRDLANARFDVVVACEVLYYMSDVPRVLTEMSRLGDACVVTYFAPAERKIGAAVRAMPGVRFDEIRHGDTVWTVAWWRNR